MAKTGRRNCWIRVVCPRCGREISSNPSHRRRHEDACAKKHGVKEGERYIAEWRKDSDEDDEPRYAHRAFVTAAAAAKCVQAESKDSGCGWVYRQVQIVDQDWLEDTGLTRLVWDSVEIARCEDGELWDWEPVT